MTTELRFDRIIWSTNRASGDRSSTRQTIQTTREGKNRKVFLYGQARFHDTSKALDRSNSTRLGLVG